MGKNSFMCLEARWNRGPQIVLQELNIPLVHPIDIPRRPYVVIESQRRCMRFTRRTDPAARLITCVPVGVLPIQKDHFVLGLAFLPPSAIPSDHEVIGSVKDAHVPPGSTVVLQLKRGRLIEIFEHVIIVLQLVNGSEFDPVALERMVTPIFLLG